MKKKDTIEERLTEIVARGKSESPEYQYKQLHDLIDYAIQEERKAFITYISDMVEEIKTEEEIEEPFINPREIIYVDDFKKKLEEI